MRLSALVWGMLLFWVGPVLAAEVPASGDAGKAFAAWLDAYNSGERAALQGYLDTHRKGREVQNELDLRESLGPLTFLTTRRATADTVEVLLRAEDSDRGILGTVQVDPADRQAISKFQLEGIELPIDYQPARLPMPALLHDAAARLEALRAADRLSGALLVARDGKVLLQWQGGLADRGRSIAVDDATRFRLASLNKMFTAVAILQLRDAGKLTLDDTLAQHLKDYPNQEVARTVTLRQVLNHTSGLGEVFGEAFEKNAASLRTHRDYWALFSEQPLLATPGSEDHYSNYGYILLGSVIEAVSGQSYYDYVEEHIHRVAGMTLTGSEPESTPVAGRAVAYTQEQGRWVQETASLPWRGTAAGGGYSTVGDLLRFAEALRGGKLLSQASLQAATAAQNNKAWYGYGFMVSGQGNTRRYGHEGGAPGANAALIILPGTGDVVVGLSNVDPAAMENMVNFIGNRLPL